MKIPHSLAVVRNTEVIPVVASISITPAFSDRKCLSPVKAVAGGLVEVAVAA